MIVHGWRKSRAKARLWSRIALVALRSYRSPPRAAAVIRAMMAERARAQPWTTRKYAHAGGRWFWNLYAPGFPSPAFDRYVALQLDRVVPFRDAAPALQTAVFAITKRCSLRCEHCCEWLALNAPETLGAAELREIATRLRREGATQLFLSGGEPLRRFEDLIETIRTVASDCDTWILTSGSGLTAERAARLREAGLTGVAVSLDHWEPAAHDRFRGVEGSFAWVERATRHAREAGLVVALSLCPTREFVSAANLDQYAKVARRLGVSFIQILEPKPVGRYAGHDVALDGGQQRLLEEFAARLNTDPEWIDFPAVSYIDHSRRRLGCHGAGDRHVYVDTDGTLHPCPFCRTPGASVLDGELRTTLADLRAGGCGVPHGEHAHG